MSYTTASGQGGTGYLVVIVTTADSALPISGATVTVSSVKNAGTTLLNRQTTNDSGEINQISLPAPSKELSQTPGNTNTYAKYNIRADFPGFYTAEHIDVPVFDGQLSVQPIRLVPLPLNEQAGRKTTVLESEPEL